MNADSEQDALLKAIFAEPADDTPRLVYADWLDEHGEGVYAEFIRVQIECNRHPRATRKSLELREREVWKKLKRVWRDLFAPPAVFLKEHFRRGLVCGSAEGSCRMPAERFVELSANLWPRIPLRSVILQCEGPAPDALFDCAHLRRLRGFAIRNAEYSRQVHQEEFVVRLFSCDRFDHLVVFGVTFVPMSRPVLDALYAAPYIRRLRSLWIGYLGLSRGTDLYGWVRYPSTVTGYDNGRCAPRPGAAAVLKSERPDLERFLVVVPPGEISCNNIIQHTLHHRAGRPRR